MSKSRNMLKAWATFPRQVRCPSVCQDQSRGHQRPLEQYVDEACARSCALRVWLRCLICKKVSNRAAVKHHVCEGGHLGTHAVRYYTIQYSTRREGRKRPITHCNGARHRPKSKISRAADCEEQTRPNFTNFIIGERPLRNLASLVEASPYSLLNCLSRCPRTNH